MIADSKPDVPAPILARWQRTVDLLGRITHTPAALITRVQARDIEMYVCSDSPLNPYNPREKSPRKCGLYCDWVIDKQRSLLVTDAKREAKWCDNPDLELKLSFYFGYPLNWPDGEPFGTLCILDKVDNARAQRYRSLLEEFQHLLEEDLAFLVAQQKLHEESTRLWREVAQNRLDVQNKANDLQEITAAMRVLLNQRESDQEVLEAQVFASIEMLVTPWLRKLQQTGLNEEQQAYVNQMRQQLSKSVLPDLHGGSELTPMEQQVAFAIGQGHSSKVIADQMHVGKCTIDFHRRNIRKKLGLQRSSKSLKQVLFAKA